METTEAWTLPNLILFPATSENLYRSVILPVSLDYARRHLRQDQITQLERCIGNAASFNCWAVTNTRRAVYVNARPGDDVLFTQNNTNLFSIWTKITHKLHNHSFGNNLWQIAGALPWEYIFILEKSRGISVDKMSLLRKLGFAEGFWLPGATRVDPNRYQQALRQYGDLSQLLSQD